MVNRKMIRNLQPLYGFINSDFKFMIISLVIRGKTIFYFQKIPKNMLLFL